MGSTRYEAGSDGGPQQEVGPSVPTHYEVLEVAPTASHDDVRRAYHRAARRWHPDRFVGRSAADASQAESRMRQVNQAWEVLGDATSRKAYDRELRGGYAGGGPGPGGANGAGSGRRVVVDDDGVIRIDPRLLDPTFLAARRDAQLNEISNRSSAILRVAPVLAVLGLLVGIFVFTAYARRGSSAAVTTTVPGPSLGAGIEANDCVSVLTGPALLARPCDATADGRVIGARIDGGTCPLGTVREVELRNGAIACLASV